MVSWIITSRRCSTGKGTTAEGPFDPSGNTTWNIIVPTLANLPSSVFHFRQKDGSNDLEQLETNNRTTILNLLWWSTCQQLSQQEGIQRWSWGNACHQMTQKGSLPMEAHIQWQKWLSNLQIKDSVVQSQVLTAKASIQSTYGEIELASRRQKDWDIFQNNFIKWSLSMINIRPKVIRMKNTHSGNLRKYFCSSRFYDKKLFCWKKMHHTRCTKATRNWLTPFAS